MKKIGLNLNWFMRQWWNGFMKSIIGRTLASTQIEKYIPIAVLRCLLDLDEVLLQLRALDPAPALGQSHVLQRVGLAR